MIRIFSNVQDQLFTLLITLPRAIKMQRVSFTKVHNCISSAMHYIYSTTQVLATNTTYDRKIQKNQMDFF